MREAPDRLRCEYQQDPLGLDTPLPRLSWWLNDSRPAELQTAYQIQAASSATGLQAGTGDLWDTGHVSSQQTMNVEYRGRPLSAGDRVWWRVRCYDSDGTPSPWSQAARFELAPAAGAEVDWVASPLIGTPTRSAPAPLLFRDFDLPRGPVSARLHVAVLGDALLELNGQALSPVAWIAGDAAVDVLPRRALDVTALLRAGPNRLGALLGDGDLRVRTTPAGDVTDGRPALWVALLVDLGSGEHVRLVSDSSWCWRPSWVLCADRGLGEELDARQHNAGWSLPEDRGRGYPVDRFALPVSLTPAQPAGVEVLAEHPLTLASRSLPADGGTRLRYDLGRELVGRARLELRAARGAAVRVRYGLAVPRRRPDSPAEAATEVTWSAPEDRYTASGGEDRLEPVFAVHAFRFVEVDIDGDLSADALRVSAVELGSAAVPVADFECDHALVSGLFQAARRTGRWGLALGPVARVAAAPGELTGADAAALMAGAGACLDVVAQLQGWISAAADPETDAWLGAQAPDALLAAVWFVYRSYGDRRLLERVYPTVQRHLERQQARIVDAPTLTDLAAAVRAMAWYGYELSLATRMAGVLGRLADLETFDARFSALRRAFRRRYHTVDGLLVCDDQLGYLLALALGILEGDARGAAMERLEAQLRRDGFHAAVDLRHASLLLEVLTLEGRLDLAYQVLLQTSVPGWLHPLHAGSELLWDMTTAVPGRLAGTALAGWLQRFVLGLELDDNLTPDLNAYRRMRIQPRPPLGPAFAAGAPVRRAAGHLDTVHGRFASDWHIDDEGFHLTVVVPGNCSARVVLPDTTEQLVMAGRHTFTVAHGALSDGTPVAPAAEQIPVLREISGSG